MAGETLELYETRKLYRSFNITVIKKLWKKIKGEYGEPIVGGDYDVNNIYKVLKMSKDNMRLIVKREYNYSEGRVLKHAVEIQNRTGIKSEYLRGCSLIKIPGFLYDGDRVEEVYDYKEWLNGHIEKTKEFKEGKTENDIKQVLEKRRLLTGRDKQGYIARKKDIQEAAEIIARFNNELDATIDELLAKDMSEIQDRELYSLLYFVRYGKKFDEYSVITIDDVIKIMQNTGYQKLKRLGEDTLNKYRKQLEKQIQIIDAIFVIKDDEKIHKN